MITRLYADNFRCLVNFEYEPAALQLIFGDNGTGKSTALELLERLREFIAWGVTAEQMFPLASLTAWQTRPEQRFELEVKGNGGKYKYMLEIEHNRLLVKNRVKREELQFDGGRLYLFDGQDAHLFRDDRSPGPVFPYDWSRSGISTIPEREDNRLLTWFRKRVNQTYFLSIDPHRMDPASLKEESAPNLTLSNFASWYRHLTQDSPESMGPLFESLGRVLEGFVSLKLSSAGEMARVLRASFRSPDENGKTGAEFVLSLGDLSPGQKCLIALFTILHCGIRPDTTIIVDEPDNFIALREIQPWVTELSDRVESQGSQCLLISHHPELIDLLAVRHGVRFTRSGLGPVRIKTLDWTEADGVRPSELVARGWED